MHVADMPACPPPEIMSQSALKHSLTLTLFSITLFVSAAAMFILQLMVGKMMLPLTGGTPAGWIVALAFFQLALLAGYALAFGLSRYTPRVHGVVYIAALAAGALCLPVEFPRQVDGEINALFVLRLLSVTVGIPAIALAATSSTIQRLFTSTGHAAAGDPYFLYAASNLGSMAGLLLYPVAIETSLTLTSQSYLWFNAYALLMTLGAACLFLSGKKGEQPPASPLSPVSWKQRAEWAVLALVPSSLLLGVTMYITTDIIAAPLIWVLPMAVYLLTFVVAFSKLPFLSRERRSGVHPAIASGAFLIALLIMAGLKIPWMACWHLMIFTIIALIYHVRLAQQRPQKERLSEFYLVIATGGAFGGVLNAFIAPLIFDQLTEYPLMIVLACVLHPALRPRFQREDFFFYLAVAGTGLAAAWLGHKNILSQVDLIVLAIFAATALAPRAAFVAGIGLFMIVALYKPAISISFPHLDVRLTERNFHGIVKVYDEALDVRNTTLPIRVLEHGTTKHGFQILVPEMETTPTAYFAESGPLGDIFKAFQPRKIGVVGLGAGTIACYATPERKFTFFELDPAVISIARNEFTFLEKCRGGADHVIVEGDGRIMLAGRNDKFDLLILDAFSSDMVPAHLLTREALQLYVSRLEEGGALAFHVSSRYLHLEKVLAATAGDIGIDYLYRTDYSRQGPKTLDSSWSVMSRNRPGLDELESLHAWKKMEASGGTRPWTDEYSSILQIIDR